MTPASREGLIIATSKEKFIKSCFCTGDGVNIMRFMNDNPVKSAIIIAILLMMVALLVGCTADDSRTPEDSEMQQPEQNAPQEEEPVVCAADVKECPDGSFVSRNPEDDCNFFDCPEIQTPAEIVAIQQDVEKIDSVEYLDSSTTSIVLIKGDKAAIFISDPNRLTYKDMKFNVLYLDRSEETAYGACVTDTNNRNKFTCTNQEVNKYAELNYNTFNFPDPFAEILSIKDGEITGSQTCERRQCDIIQYQKDGEIFRMFVRQIYPLPYRILKVTGEDEEQVLTYTNAGFNHLKEDDVTLPDHYELVE